MTSAQTQTGPTDETAVETTGRCPLLFLLGSAIAWLLVSGVLGLIVSIQAHTPAFLSGCPALSYGRARALQETAFIYGWIGNAGLGLTLWMLTRLGGGPLRGANWAGVGAFFWNLGVALGLVGISTGGPSGIPRLQVPPQVVPLLLVSYAAVAVPGVLAWTGRRRKPLFASQWYGVALLFLFPWVLSAAATMLIWFPARGVLQAVMAGWFSQSLWTLWMAPIGLAAAYYVVPRETGRVLPAYDMAGIGFWTLLFVGGWTGGRHLIGGPVPAWIPTLAIVTSVLLLAHYLVVLLNLRPAAGRGGAALPFIAAGIACYVIGGFADTVTASRAVAALTQFTWFDDAQDQLAVYGAVSLLLFGGIYFALPRLAGRPLSSGPLLKGHLVLSILGVALLVATLAGAGLAQGSALADPAVPFAGIAEAAAPWLRFGVAAQALLLFGNLMFATNFIRTAGCCGRCRALTEALSS
jgi:cytochrome c oxidase cbb3-type subunit I